MSFANKAQRSVVTRFYFMKLRPMNIWFASHSLVNQHNLPNAVKWVIIKDTGARKDRKLTLGPNKYFNSTSFLVGYNTAGVKCRSNICRSLRQVTARAKGS